ncbi:MAG TPA: secretin N-terminal domain-containing protein [Thermoanaerobaculia bacterium]|nr:secretin N-terminal domain-containing protein [Thermoanaerobaculia bacterium]
MKLLRIVGLAAALAGAAGCSAYRAYEQGKDAEDRQQWDVAVMKIQQAAQIQPNNPQYHNELIRVKQKAAQFHFEKGKLYRSSGNPEMAVVELEQTVLLDPTQDYAEVELRKAREDVAKAAAERNGDTKLEALKKKTRGARARPPMLEPASDKPISLNFPQAKPIKQIYQSLAAAAGINVIFDPQLKDENVSIVLTNLPFQAALETLIRQENHFYKVIDEKTMLIAADTPANRKTYEDLVIRTFFLSNGDVTEVSNALRALLQTTRISINKAENSITLRDTADKVAIAERIVEQNDKQLSEVVVDVELLQVNTNKLLDLGPLLTPKNTISVSAPAPGGTSNIGGAIPAGQFTWDQLKQLSINSFGFAIPSLTYNFIKNQGAAELLAQPQLRIAEGQKAQLVIGDRTPIPVTTFNTGTTVGGNIVPVTSFQYQDVGIKIEVEPRVHHNREVTLKLTVEVSQISGSVPVEGGSPLPIIGTRTISSNIRLKDGETNLLAGLFRRDRSRTDTQFPFLSEIPIIGRLVTNTNRQDQTTDIVLTLTPHIIRIPDITEEDVTPVYVGTDQNISYQGAPRVESAAGNGPFDIQRRQAPNTPPPPPAQTAPPAINLAPGAGPTDPFAKPVPQPTPPPQPQGAALATSAPAVTVASATTTPVFDLDPPSSSLKAGETMTVSVRATGDSLPPSALAVRYDPAVVAVVGVEPVLEDPSAAETRIEPGRVVLDLPGGTVLAGTKAVARIALRALAPGRSALTFEQAPGGTSSATIEVTK